MIVLYAEVWPGGDQSKARPIGSLGIWNNGLPGDLLESYAFEIDEDGPHAVVKKGVVHAHNPKQSVWKLVQRVLDQVFPKVTIT